MFSSLGKATFEQDAFRLRPLMPHGGGTGGTSVISGGEFIQPLKVYDATNTQWIWNLSTGAMIDMVGTVVATGYATFKVPAGYSGSIIFSPIFHMGGSTGDVVITHHGYCANVGQSNVATVFNFNGGSEYTYTPGDTKVKKEFSAGFACAGGEYVHLYFERVGTATADTSGNALRFWGWDVEYSGGNWGGSAVNTPEWVPVVYGYNVTDVSAINLTSIANTTLEIELPADKQALGLASFATPKDYTGNVTINSVVYIGANQTMKFRTNVVGLYHPKAAGSGVWDTSSTGGHATDEVITSDFSYNGWYSVAAHSETITKQTVVWVQCVRLGTATDDTSSQSARHHGFYIVYG